MTDATHKEDAGRTGHTPLPWRAQNAGVYAVSPHAEIATTGGNAEFSNEVCLANAAFIVRAVNSHADLVAALRMARATIELNQHTCSLFEHIDAVISKATGTSP